MVQDNSKSIPMYVLNLDNSRIFWISLLFLIFFGLCFLLGMFFGRRNAPSSASKTDTSESRDVQYDSFLLSKMSIETQNNNFEFYKVLNKEKLSREDIEHSIPYKKSDVKKEQNVKVENQYPETQRQVVDSAEKDSDPGKNAKKPEKIPEVTRSVPEKPPVEKSVHVVRKRSSKNSKSSIYRYSIQAASYVNNATADINRQKIITKKHQAYIVKSHVNNQIYFRLRVGPFSSREKAVTVLEDVRGSLGFTGAYLCTN